MNISLHNVESITIDEPYQLAKSGNWVRHITIKTNECTEIVDTTIAVFSAGPEFLDIKYDGGA